VIFPPPARSRPESAMHLRIPKTSLQVPSAAAVSGKAGIVRGTDDCGEKVISYIQPVPGSPWFLQSKIDEREDFALWRSQSRLLILAFSGIAALLLALGLAAGDWAGVDIYRFITSPMRAEPLLLS